MPELIQSKGTNTQAYVRFNFWAEMRDLTLTCTGMESSAAHT